MCIDGFAVQQLGVRSRSLHALPGPFVLQGALVAEQRGAMRRSTSLSNMRREAPGCKVVTPLFGLPGGAPRFCAAHRLPGMVRQYADVRRASQENVHTVPH